MFTLNTDDKNWLDNIWKKTEIKLARVAKENMNILKLMNVGILMW